MAETAVATHKEVIYPDDVRTWAQKVAYLLQLREKVRLDFNAFADGLRDEDGSLSEADKAKVRTYKVDAFYPRNAAISMAIGELKHAPPAGTLEAIDLETAFHDVEDVNGD